MGLKKTNGDLAPGLGEEILVLLLVLTTCFYLFILQAKKVDYQVRSELLLEPTPEDSCGVHDTVAMADGVGVDWEEFTKNCEVVKKGRLVVKCNDVAWWAWVCGCSL